MLLQVQNTCISVLTIDIAEAMTFSVVRSFLPSFYISFLLFNNKNVKRTKFESFSEWGQSFRLSFVDPYLGLVIGWWSSGCKFWLLVSWFFQASSLTRRWFCCRESYYLSPVPIYSFLLFKYSKVFQILCTINL